MNNRLSQLAIHGLGCLTFLALPYLFASNGLSKLTELPYNPHEQRNVVSYLLTIAFFYTNYFVLIPKLFFRRKYVLYGVCALGCFLLIESSLVTINRQNGAPPPIGRIGPTRPFRDRSQRPPMPPGEYFPGRDPEQRGLPSEFSQTFFLTLAGFLMALALRINSRWRETEQEKTLAELAYLKAQINPHFLFNTLNSIYSLAIVESPATADALVKLSSFLRYVIQESQKNQVSLHNELAYIDQYIALQKLRLGDTAAVDFVVRGTPNGKQIVPLLLISFIENAFKYGVSPEEPSSIQIAITIQDNRLCCHVFNKKVRVFQPTAVASGIGLPNTKARLAIQYPDRHQLVIKDQPDSFTVDLALTLS
ncbi:histidine kinase [Spirosoma humi]